MKKMTAVKRDELYNLIQFVTMAYIEPDINEQYRDWKPEKINSPHVLKHKTGKRKKLDESCTYYKSKKRFCQV